LKEVKLLLPEAFLAAKNWKFTKGICTGPRWGAYDSPTHDTLRIAPQPTHRPSPNPHHPRFLLAWLNAHKFTYFLTHSIICCTVVTISQSEG